jgi:hypothetical protein
MTTDHLVTRLLRLWDDLPPDESAEAAFGALYTDPVVINGSPMTVRDLVARARVTAGALAERSTEILSEVVTDDATAVVFRIHARHVGPLPTPLGEVRGSGERITLQVIDVLHLRHGRISELWMVGDYLGALGASGAFSLD